MSARRGNDALMPRLQHNWDWRAAANFIAGGAGGGLLAIAAAASLAGEQVRTLLPAGMVLVVVGLACVWLEIGRPLRALNVFLHPGRSWMSRESLVAPLLLASGAVAVATGASAWVLATGVLGAAFLYCQARMLGADKGIPAWRHPRCPPLMTATGFAEGAAVLALSAPLAGVTAIGVASLALVVLLAIRAALWKRYVGALRAQGAPLGSLSALGAIDAPLLVYGHLLPAALALAAALGDYGGAAPSMPAVLLALAGAGALGGGWLLKYTLVRRAAFTQGLAIAHLPVLSHGKAGTAVKPGWSARR
ncbi:MAG: phenylacetyl-CoA:acceptor oxidoreductase [Burkholderiales bacterium]|nr:phenylacetyl-CoA:acceptor oxidoreductase [Burkholderiales bacterium]